MNSQSQHKVNGRPVLIEDEGDLGHEQLVTEDFMQTDEQPHLSLIELMLPFAEDSTKTQNAEGLLPWQLARSEVIAELLRPRIGAQAIAGTYSTTDDEYEEAP